MTLREYLASTGLTLAEFGAMTGNSHASVSRWASGVCPPSYKVALKIEEVTKGKVTRHDMRPDIYGEKKRRV